ncbi:MAG: hypothetical protein P8Y45_07260 [Exilibacterium sp.]
MSPEFAENKQTQLQRDAFTPQHQERMSGPQNGTNPRSQRQGGQSAWLKVNESLPGTAQQTVATDGKEAALALRQPVIEEKPISSPTQSNELSLTPRRNNDLSSTKNPVHPPSKNNTIVDASQQGNTKQQKVETRVIEHKTTEHKTREIIRADISKPGGKSNTVNREANAQSRLLSRNANKPIEPVVQTRVKTEHRPEENNGPGQRRSNSTINANNFVVPPLRKPNFNSAANSQREPLSDTAAQTRTGPSVQVSIGRIEIRAAAGAAKQSQAPKPKPQLGLAEYLRSRGGVKA